MNHPLGTRSHRPSRPSPAALLGAAACLFLVSGCGGDPMEHKVNSADQVSFSIWESKAESSLAPDQVADIKAALQEYKFHIMADGSAHGSEAIDAAALEMINGKTLREVILQGLNWELDRTEAERAKLEDSMKKNAQMTTRPGDTASANYLSDLHDRQVARLEAAAEEVKKTRERITAETAPAAK